MWNNQLSVPFYSKDVQNFTPSVWNHCSITVDISLKHSLSSKSFKSSNSFLGHIIIMLDDLTIILLKLKIYLIEYQLKMNFTFCIYLITLSCFVITFSIFLFFQFFHKDFSSRQKQRGPRSL